MVDINEVLKDRGNNYGSFEEHAYITQIFKEVQRDKQSSSSSSKLTASQQEALDMIFHKIGRIINGNPNHKDSWVDIAGYATLIANEIGEE